MSILSNYKIEIINGIKYYLVPVEAHENGLKIKVGKTYLDRSGDRIKIVADLRVHLPNFNAENVYVGISLITAQTETYFEDGRHIQFDFDEVDVDENDDSNLCVLDLIMEMHDDQQERN